MNKVHIDFDVKTRRLKMTCPFYLADAMRGFPSRRFNPKDKTWRMPLVRQNISHLHETKHIYLYEFTESALDAVRDFEKLTAGPAYQPFPYHLYDFTESKTAYLPMDHQRKMLDKAWNLPAIAWFAKMGTGKTFAAVHLACARFKAGLSSSVPQRFVLLGGKNWKSTPPYRTNTEIMILNQRHYRSFIMIIQKTNYRYLPYRWKVLACRPHFMIVCVVSSPSEPLCSSWMNRRGLKTPPPSERNARLNFAMLPRIESFLMEHPLRSVFKTFGPNMNFSIRTSLDLEIIGLTNLVTSPWVDLKASRLSGYKILKS